MPSSPQSSRKSSRRLSRSPSIDVRRRSHSSSRSRSRSPSEASSLDKETIFLHFLENKFNELTARYEELLRFEMELQNRERNVELQVTQMTWMRGYNAGARGRGGRGRGRGGYRGGRGGRVSGARVVVAAQEPEPELARQPKEAEEEVPRLLEAEQQN